jgi:hypothetical protein
MATKIVEVMEKKRVQRPLATIEVEIGNVLMGIDGLSIASSS